MAYKSELERFDMERGDVLLISREMAQAIAGFGADIGAPIFFALIEWFSGKPGDETPKLKDPRDRGFLAMLMEHQKKYAARRADFLKSQSQKGQASAAARKARQQSTETNHGQPQPAVVAKINRSEVEEESTKGKYFPSSTTSNPPNQLGQVGGTPTHAAGGPCVTAAPGGTRTATRVAYVEPLSGDKIEERTFAEADLIERPVTFMLDAIGESDELQTRNALKKAVEELGPEAYARTCWRFIADMVQTENAAAAVLAKSRASLAKRYGDDGEARLVKTLRDIVQHGSTNTENDWFVQPWMKWRDFQPGRFLMGALSEAKLAAGIQTKRKPNGKRKCGE